MLNVLKGMKVHKSPGPDQVDPCSLHEAREEIEGIVAELHETYLSEVFEDWRVVKLCLI